MDETILAEKCHVYKAFWICNGLNKRRDSRYYLGLGGRGNLKNKML